ncbi:MAG: hypothetical protein KH301_01345 [Brachyspira sp.]|nr:hypothetical protein [Brachyspira sp.]
MGLLFIGGIGNVNNKNSNEGSFVTVKQKAPNSVFGETNTQNTNSADTVNIQITPKEVTFVDNAVLQQVKELMQNKLSKQDVSPEQEFNQLKETLLVNSKITVREDPKLGTCYSCRGFETNMRGKEGAIDLASLALKDLVNGKKQYLELSQKDQKELTPEEGLQVFAYEQTLKAMQLTVDADGNIVNTENCEFI